MEPSFLLDILCQIETVKEQCPKRCNSCPEPVGIKDIISLKWIISNSITFIQKNKKLHNTNNRSEILYITETTEAPTTTTGISKLIFLSWIFRYYISKLYRIHFQQSFTIFISAMPKCERKYNGYYSYGDCGSQNGVKSFEECCELTKQRNATSSRNIIRFSWNGNR